MYLFMYHYQSGMATHGAEGILLDGELLEFHYIALPEQKSVLQEDSTARDIFERLEGLE